MAIEDTCGTTGAVGTLLDCCIGGPLGGIKGGCCCCCGMEGPVGTEAGDCRAEVTNVGRADGGGRFVSTEFPDAPESGKKQQI